MTNSKSNSTIAEFFSFLVNPSASFFIKEKLSIKQGLFFVLKLVSFGILIGILINLFTSYISNFAGFNQTDNNLVNRDLKIFPPIIGFLLIVVIGPLLEELAFRLFLTTKRFYFFFGLNFFIYYIWQFIGSFFNYKNTFLYSSNGLLATTIAIFTLTGICSFIVSSKWLESTINRYFKWFVYSTGIIFGLIHITNYQQYFYLIPLLVLPQISVSFIFAFVRTKLNFWWGFICHSLYNFALGLPLFSLALFVGNDRSSQIYDLLQNKNIDTVTTLSESEKFIVSGLNLFTLVLYLAIICILIYTILEFFVAKKKFLDVDK